MAAGVSLAIGMFRIQEWDNRSCQHMCQNNNNENHAKLYIDDKF
jgi:hypothetical protein